MPEQSEFFAFPVIAEGAKAKSTLRQYLEATETHGPLLPVGMVAAALNLHRSRVYQFIDAGRLPTLTIAGHTWVPASALELFWTEERRTGRPRKQQQISNTVRK